LGRAINQPGPAGIGRITLTAKDNTTLLMSGRLV
jgi:hypothetical protein